MPEYYGTKYVDTVTIRRRREKKTYVTFDPISVVFYRNDLHYLEEFYME